MDTTPSTSACSPACCSPTPAAPPPEPTCCGTPTAATESSQGCGGHAHQQGHAHGHGHDHDHGPTTASCGSACQATPLSIPPLAGLAPGQQRLRLHIADMDCPTEEALLRKHLAGEPAIRALHFDLLGRVLSIDHDAPDPAGLVQALQQRIQAAGLAALPLDGQRAAPVAPAVPVPLRWRMAAAGAAAVASEALHYLGVAEAAVIACALLAVTLGGLPTLRKGWVALRSLTLNIHLLMSLAVIGALALGQWPEAAMVVWLFGLSEMLEALSLARARDAIRALSALAPETAWLRLPDGQWTERPSEQVSLGAVLRIRAGERVPLDGQVIEGQSSVNEAALTGESLPVPKQPGDALLAGSVNELGLLLMTVTAAKGHTLLDRMAQAVQEAQAQRAPTQRFVDRFARVYTPLVVAAALLLALLPPLWLGGPFTPWIYKALVLMVVACPCALVISTPVTVVSALTAGARRGLLIKGGLYLEQAHLLKSVALDKTGTLTEGRPALVGRTVLGTLDEDGLLRHAASLDAGSRHPLALALLEAAAAQDLPLLPLQEFETLPGRGVRARLHGQPWHLGNETLARELGALSPAAQDAARRWSESGCSVLWLLQEGPQGWHCEGLLALRDRLRAHSADAVAALQAAGVQVHMLSGDQRGAALATARELGLPQAQVQAPLLPEQKLAAIALLRKRGLVAMVGDGVNDAPALARADIGIAMGAAGTATALETADIALMQDDLRRLPELLALSRDCNRVLWQNIALALGLKACVLALTLAGWGSLWLAVLADAGAALLVVLLGLRLLRWQPGAQTVPGASRPIADAAGGGR
ncbi:heavy metal translocating P-type ATPase [Roseateles sp. DB2]|uniref:heavy metal translocating P-type ATPase n=1 Tax=Roseateles sp. DB2 TaxID=3453717 RepID=UPI003EEE7C88